MSESAARFGGGRRIVVLGGLVVSTALAGCSSDAIPASTGGAGTSSTATTTHATTPTATAPAAGSSQQVRVHLVTPAEFKKIIAEQIGHVVLVDFWATFCGPCREKFPKTLALAQKYAGDGLRVISMSMDSPEPKYKAEVVKFLTQQRSFVTNLENSLDDAETAFEALKIDGGALPHYQIYDRKGNLFKKFGGDPDHPFDEKDIEQAIALALKEK
jgi:thiol-disulfide isomerase/thioredoxin